MNIQQLLYALKEFKILSFMNNPQNKYIIQNFIKSNFSLATAEGQKRIVINDPQDNTKVIKIGCSEDGIWDNSCEYIMYQTIFNLCKSQSIINTMTQDRITESDLLLFPNCELVEGDPFLLRAEKIETPETLTEFHEWKNTTAKLKYPGASMTDAYLWNEFLLTYVDPISKQPILKNDFDRGFAILNSISIHSDLGYESPFNKGVRRVNGTLRGVFLDLGSCLPIIDMNQRPICPACGQTHGGILSYYHIGINDLNQLKDGIIEASTIKSFYTCSNPSCTNNSKFVVSSYLETQLLPPELYDTNVFNDFINQIRFNPSKYTSYVTLFYTYAHLVSAPIGMDKAQFYTYISNFIPKDYLNNNVSFNISYENYVFKTIASLFNTCFITQNQNFNPLTAILNNSEISYQIVRGQLNFNTYKNSLQRALAQYNITGSHIVCKISAITYLSKLVEGLHTNSSNSDITFYRLYELDNNSFINTMQMFIQMYGQQDVINLFNFLHL